MIILEQHENSDKVDIKLNFIEKGSGKPLILLHGNGEDHTYFVHQINEFSQFFRVIALDTRGHGQSPRGEALFTIVQFVEDLYSFMAENNIQKAHLLGFSDGGNIALTFALKHPEMVDNLILNGANLNSKGVKYAVQLPIEFGYRMAKYFAKKDEKARRKAEMLGLMVNEPNISIAELETIQNRTLVIAGTNDMIKKSHTQLIYNHLPNAELSFIKGNHFIANQNPKDFNQRVLTFLMNDGK